MKSALALLLMLALCACGGAGAGSGSGSPGTLAVAGGGSAVDPSGPSQDPLPSPSPGGAPAQPPTSDPIPTGAAPEAPAGPVSSVGSLRSLTDPLSVTQPPFPTLTHPQAPSPLWGSLGPPYPTNAWWMNLVLKDGNQPVNVLPYLVKTLPDGLHVCHPERVIAPTCIVSVYLDNLVLGSVEPLGNRRLTGYDPLSVTLEWPGLPSGTGMDAPLVRGMACATVRYRGLTPRLTTQHAILSVTGGGTRFEVALNNQQTWVIYASEPVTFQWGGSTLTATAPLTGTLRVARLTSRDAAAVLDAHRDAVPVGGTVELEADGDVGTVRFRWRTQGSGPLLMMALPHHLDSAVGPAVTGYELRTIKGWMTGLEGAVWELREELPTLSWTAPRPIDPARVESVRQALYRDMGKRPVATDPYFFGKQAAAMGRLALIADELGETGKAREMRSALKAALEPWLNGANSDPLRYDTTWGGLVALNGVNDVHADFGAGYYNDHHFHYGYLVYAAACLSRADPAWESAHREKLLSLVRDYANPSPADPRFPL
ncbi:MAG: glycosyl hydrolase, partial [Candidatus Eremiobacterota bacterium]